MDTNRYRSGSDGLWHPDRGDRITVAMPIPANDDRIYRYKPTNQILRVLADDPYATHSFRELSRQLDHPHSAIKDAVDVLEANELVDVEPGGNRKQVSINRRRLWKPQDPILQIPQETFHAPLQAIVDRIKKNLTNVKGILVFGSVAQGQADRKSDIDLWVLVQEERGTNQREANQLAKEIGQKRFDGHRYEFQILVESVESALQYGDRLSEVLQSGLTLYRTETLQRVISEVVEDAR